MPSTAAAIFWTHHRTTPRYSVSSTSSIFQEQNDPPTRATRNHTIRTGAPWWPLLVSRHTVWIVSELHGSPVASQSWRLGHTLPCSVEFYHRWDRLGCGRVDFGVVRWRSRETRFYLDSVWVCWRRTTRLFRWCRRWLKIEEAVYRLGFRTGRVVCRQRMNESWCDV